MLNNSREQHSHSIPIEQTITMRFEMFGFSLMVTAALLSRNGLSSAFTFLPIPSRVPGFRYPLSMSSNAMAEKVLQSPKWPPEWPYSEGDFSRMDESDDTIFYDSPRLVRTLVADMEMTRLALASASFFDLICHT